MVSLEAHHSQNPPQRPLKAETTKTCSVASLGEKAAIMSQDLSTQFANQTIIAHSQMRHNTEALHRLRRLSIAVGPTWHEI